MDNKSYIPFENFPKIKDWIVEKVGVDHKVVNKLNKIKHTNNMLKEIEAVFKQHKMELTFQQDGMHLTEYV